MDGASGSGFGGVWLVDGSDAAFSSDKLRYFCQLSEADPEADPEEFIQFMRADSLPKKTPKRERITKARLPAHLSQKGREGEPPQREPHSFKKVRIE
jgi:hypothetical protein